MRFGYVWEVSSVSESVRLLARQAEKSTSGWGSLWERYPLGSWFSTSAFRKVPGTVPETVRTRGFQRNSSNLDRAPKMRDYVLLNSSDSFSVTLPSISSETCAIYSSVIPGADEFCEWLFLGYSCVSLDKAAKFAIFAIWPILPSPGKVQLWWKLNYFVFWRQFLNSTKT